MRRFVIVVQLVLVVGLAGAAAAPAGAPRRARRASCSRHYRGRVAHKRRARCRRVRLSHGGRDLGPAITGRLIVGLNADVAGWGGASTAGRLDQVVSQTGTKWLRETFDWGTVEPQPGVFDFSYYDHFMLLAARRGEQILALLYDTPSWAGPSYNAIPSDPSAYAQYVAAVVNRYGPHGSFWAQHPDLAGSAIRAVELWNEPFFSTGDDGDYDPGRYARLVKAAGAATHAADPAVNVLMAAEMESARAASGRWQWWVDALYQAVPELNRYFDGVAMHDYGNDTTTRRPMIPGQPYGNYGHVLRIEDLRRQFVQHGASDKPFWITEVGWSTCAERGADCVSAPQQAQNLTTLFSDVRGMWSSWVQGVFVYRYGDGASVGTVQDSYGLTRLDGTPKPALSVFRSAAEASAGAAHDRRSSRSG